MKKIVLLALTLVMSLAASAQFEKGKGYLGASLSGLEVESYCKQFHLGIDAKAGYLFADNLMALAEVGYNHWQKQEDEVTLGASGRYYIIQNGLYLGAGLKYKHTIGYNDLLPGVQVGYAFFLSRTVTLEPALYFDISTKSSDYSCYGLRIGIGVYLFKDQMTLKR